MSPRLPILKYMLRKCKRLVFLTASILFQTDIGVTLSQECTSVGSNTHLLPPSERCRELPLNYLSASCDAGQLSVRFSALLFIFYTPISS